MSMSGKVFSRGQKWKAPWDSPSKDPLRQQKPDVGTNRWKDVEKNSFAGAGAITRKLTSSGKIQKYTSG